jgi:hypothetical protein
VDLDGFAVVASSPTRGVGIASSRRLATSPTAGPRSHRTADPEVCAREVSTRVGQVSGLTVTNVQLLATHLVVAPATQYSELSAFLEVVRAPSSLSFTEGQPAPDRVPKCTSVAVYELNATTQALRNRTRRTRIHVERYWPARCGLRTSDTYERCSSSPARLRPPSFRLLGVPLLQPPGPALSPS